MKPINNMKNNEIVKPSINLFSFSFLIFITIESTSKNQKIAPAKEKL
jgi:hypothetical protein